MQLRLKFVLLVLPLLVVPLLLLGIVAYHEVRVLARERAIEEMNLLLEKFGEQFKLKREAALASVRVFSNHALVHQYALTDDLSERAVVLQRPLLRQFAEFQSAFPSYSAIRFVQPDGAVAAEWKRTTDADKLFDTPRIGPAFRTELAATSGGPRAFFLPEKGEEPTRLIAAVDLNLVSNIDTDPTAEPQLRGYLAVTVDLSTIAGQIHERRVGEHGALMLVDAEGTPLLGSESPASAFEGDVPEAFVAGASDVWRGNWGGMETVIRSRSIEPGLRLLAVLPADEIRAAERDLGRIVLAITVAAVVVIPALILFVLGRLVVLPLQRLSCAADRIGEGELDTAVPVVGGGEVGVLGRTLDSMRERLAIMNREFAHQAQHDSLTGLPNRRLLDEYLMHALPDALRHRYRLAVLFLDLDGFKQINDNQGHAVGDALLRGLAQRLLDSIRDEDYVASDPGPDPDLISRIGGDEFIILVGHLHTADEAGRVAHRILDTVRRPLDIEGAEFGISASIGIAVFPEDGQLSGDLIRRADTAMYQAKDQGKNQIAFYSPALDDLFRSRARMEEKLRQAVFEGALSLHYQPQVDVKTERIVGFEALARWHDADAGWIGPAQFVPLAERSGFIGPLTRHLLQLACWQIRTWQEDGLTVVPVSVNVSGEQIISGEIVDMVGEALAATGVDPGVLRLEVTETTLIKAETGSVQAFQRLRDMGVRLCLDDFGTGYSSLKYLRRYAFDVLKIDRSFVNAIGVEESDPALIVAMITMADALGLSVVAEGVETACQLEFLRDAGCGTIQGYLFGRPVEARKAGDLLADSMVSLDHATSGGLPGRSSR
ncbi:bifunctional diguanylate cyclase/phosphodiesterase [Arhodomonas sp. AD133]|uniref:bifunctional diguanylate cyclase/phosphodiesterase n=1 Tax=Arhodomonas sp. AD133 TaxID=3415009 RepID=UPI003EBD91B8